MKQAKLPSGRAFRAKFRQSGQWTIYEHACPYCGKVSRDTHGKFKDGAMAKVKYNCPHFKGGLVHVSCYKEKKGERNFFVELFFVFMPIPLLDKRTKKEKRK